MLNLPEEVTTDADGLATIPLQPALPGTCVVAFILPESSSDDVTYFANVRVLPTDDYSNVNDSELTFQFLYKEVLKYYYLLYPSMNRQIDLSNENKVKFKAQYIRERIDAKFFEIVVLHAQDSRAFSRQAAVAQTLVRQTNSRFLIATPKWFLDDPRT